MTTTSLRLGARRRPPGASWRRGEAVAAAGVLAAGGAFIAYAGRFWSFFYDEWGIILYRRSGGPSAFLAAHNGHLQAVVIGVYRLLFATVGLPCLPLLVLGHAWQVLFWAVNLGFVIPMIVLCALVSADRFRPWLVGAGLSLALASSGLGVAVAVAAGVLAVRAQRRRAQLIAVLAPATLWAAWFLFCRPYWLPPASLREIPGAAARGDVGSIRLPVANIARAPGYLLHSADAAAAALAATRAQFASPTASAASRYVYPAAFLLALILLEAFAGVQPPKLIVLVLAVAVVFVVESDVNVLDRYGNAARGVFTRQAASLRRGACDPGLPADYPLDPAGAPGVTAGAYRAAVRALGAPPGQACPGSR
ncbi:MAG: hypothetical protein ACYCO3_14430 [Mycobacteriales bacterium]